MLIIEVVETQKASRAKKKSKGVTAKKSKGVTVKKLKRVITRAKKSIAGLAEDKNPRSFADPSTKFGFENILDYDTRPLISIPEIFEDLATRIHEHGRHSLRRFCQLFNKKPLKVLTLCSGTESPILAMQQIQKSKSFLISGIES